METKKIPLDKTQLEEYNETLVKWVSNSQIPVHRRANEQQRSILALEALAHAIFLYLLDQLRTSPEFVTTALKALKNAQITKEQLKCREVKQEWKVVLASNEAEGASKRVVLTDRKKSPPRAHTVHSGGVSFPDLNNAARNRCLQTLYSILSSDETKNLIARQGRTDFMFSESEILTMCIHIERKLYSDSSKDYLSNVRERILILKDRGNPNLKVNIVLGEISTDDFATLEAKDLADDETKKKIQAGKDWSMSAYSKSDYPDVQTPE